MPKVDYLGRTTIPKEIRETLQLEPEDKLQCTIANGKIVLTPEKKRCKLCGQNTTEIYAGVPICEECQKVLKNGNR